MKKLSGLIAAAGKSSRASGCKLLYAWPPGSRTGTIIETVISHMSALCDQLTVVTGARHDDLFPVLEKYSHVRIVLNIRWSEGMLGSIRSGIADCLSRDSDGILYCPADYPAIRAETFRLVADAGKTGSRICQPVYKNEAGPPVYIPAGKAADFIGSEWKGSFREWIAQESPDYIPCTDMMILDDIDSDEDYRRVGILLQNNNGNHKVDT